MKKVPLKDLSADAQRLIADAEQAGGLVVEDEQGRPRSRVYAYAEPTAAERQTAWDRLRDFQGKVQQSFDDQGVSEADLDQLLQEDE